MFVVDIEDVVKEALKELKHNKLIDDDDITGELKEAAKTEAELTKSMLNMINTTSMQKVEEEMSKIIGFDRVELIKKSFDIETYSMKVLKKPDGQSTVLVQRGGNEFLPEIMLKTNNDIETAIMLQWASVVVELFLFVFSCVGIEVDLNPSEMKAIVEEVEGFIRGGLQTALDKFLEAWNNAGGSVWGKAKAIFALLKDIFSLGFFWKITKLIIKKMSILQKIKALAKVAMLIVAAIKTGGAAIIARIALALKNSDKLVEKIRKIIMLSSMKETMK